MHRIEGFWRSLEGSVLFLLVEQLSAFDLLLQKDFFLRLGGILVRGLPTSLFGSICRLLFHELFRAHRIICFHQVTFSLGGGGGGL